MASRQRSTVRVVLDTIVDGLVIMGVAAIILAVAVAVPVVLDRLGELRPGR